MNIYGRKLFLPKILKQKSHFLFGPRSVGKTSLIESQLPNVKKYDLLDSDDFDRLIRRPKLIEEEWSPQDQILVIDEIQKLPKLLDSVQRLIQKHGVKILLTGSSARKLKRGGANLLGGRAWETHLHPLIFSEIDDFDLLKYLNRGGIPHVYLSSNPEQELRAYLNLYLKEEIIAEAQLRKVDQFVRFLDVLGLQNGEELHYQGISSDTGIPVTTVQTYIQLIEDTLIGYELSAFTKTKKRKAISRSKLYLFDLGVANHLAQKGEIRDGSELYGKVFEHFIVNEVRAWNTYTEQNQKLSYWRSSTHEVDLIVGNQFAIEIKSGKLVNEGQLRGLKALREEQLIQNYCVVSRDPHPRVVDGIQIYPYELFLELLWNGTLFETK